jgi:hypothetical protein
MGSVTTDSEADLSPGELVLLRDAETDDVSFVWVLIDLGLRENPPSSPDWRPGPRSSRRSTRWSASRAVA